MKFLNSKMTTLITMLVVLAAIAIVMKLDARQPIEWASGFIVAAGAVLLSLTKSLAAPDAPAAVTAIDTTKKEGS